MSVAISLIPLARSLITDTAARTWEALGPFSLGTRELPYLGSPLSSFVPPNQTHEAFFADLKFGSGDWPSAYGIDGKADWTLFQEDADGWVKVTWNRVDWTNLRGTEGWAGVQFMTLLRTSLILPSTVSPSSLLNQIRTVNFDLTQAHSFALIHKDPTKRSDHVEWHSGDLYTYSTSTPRKHFPSQELGWTEEIESGEYWVLVKALYEIRMFGDPWGEPPTIQFRFGYETIPKSEFVPTSNVQTIFETDALSEDAEMMEGDIGLGDVIQGWIWGNIAGLSLKAEEKQVQVIAATLIERIKGLHVSLAVSSVDIEAYQIRPIPIIIFQTSPLPATITYLSIRLEFSNRSHRPITKRIPVNHRSHWSLPSLRETYPAIRYTFRDVDGTAQYAMALPPLQSGNQTAVLLATHGAGVEAEWSFWTESIRRQKSSWIVFATGKTFVFSHFCPFRLPRSSYSRPFLCTCISLTRSWGYDYHGPSLRNVLQARQSLSAVINLGSPDRVSDWSPHPGTLLIGHSNGGQGAMYLCQRFPDMFQGVVSAAAYLKIQAYVGYSQWTSMHWADPALAGVLMNGLSMWDNDIHASNAAWLPVLLVHGRDDDNVPVWHGREMRSLIGQWTGSLDHVSLYEVPNEGHWFDDILSSNRVQDFLEVNLNKTGLPKEYQKEGFTLTVANPDEMGSKGGWRVVQLNEAGRLARVKLRVFSGGSNITQIKTSNVLTLSLTLEAARRLFPEESPLTATSLQIDDSYVSIDFSSIEAASEHLVFHRSSVTSSWRLISATDSYTLRVYGPIIQILTSQGPLVLITPSCDSTSKHETSVARRIAHDAWVYGRLDTVIICAEQAIKKIQAGDPLMEGSWVVIGLSNSFATELLRSTPITFDGPHSFALRFSDERTSTFDARQNPSTGVLSLHPHPIRPAGLTLLLGGTDPSGLERAYRLFPVRTGTPLLDWVIIGPEADYKGAGGIIGTGFWSRSWTYNPGMSWLSL
ncbi:Peptidase S9, prolyl oligopeptidase, catalytic domain [Phaffia rhodozyma]|uniref:Peptidase S9, prolyl oligopeptidase, catalytic domain n=1 Tax=Phaffia rhodozyma TaxID=264483 RepID=A0A0F7SPR3_PHARH|nr:Peptidase S9, prolyl oligopeptidase, catalytic domain [Phaffia rhodozyma]